ncbi:hypothetical protein HPB49_018265 [Dermacentor silvarum]|uniref:Uncharacterized protein n=1 Tax=Dermacentor silvarum TaxID=543639 RepID=A0ACB8CZH5_DERSI|nr:hypothetical protein HPB49_018265 [Dermacentor silvarum]
MKEANLLRLVHSFIISRITYAIPYLKTTKAERDKVDILFRKGVKTALGLPACTSTETILNLGVSNTLDEMCEAKLTAQYVRLTGSKTGRSILRKLGYRNPQSREGITAIPKEIANRLRIPPIPRNMHPIYNDERRRSRVQRLQSSLLQKQGVVYTDAAEYPEGHYAAVVVSDKGELISSCSVRHSSPEEAEMAAIALAITNPSTRIIITDSKTAIKAYDTAAGQRKGKPYFISPEVNGMSCVGSSGSITSGEGILPLLSTPFFAR